MFVAQVSYTFELVLRERLFTLIQTIFGEIWFESVAGFAFSFFTFQQQAD